MIHKRYSLLQKEAQCSCCHREWDTCRFHHRSIAQICCTTIDSKPITTSGCSRGRHSYSCRPCTDWWRYSCSSNWVCVAGVDSFLEEWKLIDRNIIWKLRTAQYATDVPETCIIPLPFELKDGPQPSVPIPQL